MTERIAILGGGALGLTLAYRLAKAGASVVVYESELEPGGLAAGFRVGPSGAWLEKFYHHLFGTDRDAIALIKELGLGDKLEWTHANTSHLVRGQTYRLDGVIPALRFGPVAVPDRLRLLGGIGFLKLWPAPRTLEGKTASAWMRRWMGSSAYTVAFEPLLKAKFGGHSEEIALPWMWSRLHFRTSKLGYLRGGFQPLYESLVTQIEAAGGHVRLGARVSAVRRRETGSFEVDAAGGTEEYAKVVSTLAPRLTYRIVPEMPGDFQQRYDWNLAYGAHCLILALDRPLLRDVYWLSIADPDYPFLAVVEHTNMQRTEDYGGRHLVYLGNYLPMDHPLLRAPKEDVLTEFLPHLSRINADFRPDWVSESWAFSAPYAQPIVTREYASHIPPHVTPIPGLYLANMFQVYPQDRGQNYSIRLANNVADLLLRDASQ